MTENEVFAVSNKSLGNSNFYYISCKNQDQLAYTRVKFIQSPCIKGKNCPKVVDVDK